MLPVLTDPASAASLPLRSGGEGEDPFEVLFGHLLPHRGFLPWQHDPDAQILGIPVWNIQFFQVLAVLLIFAAFAGVARAVRQDTGGRRSRVLAGWVAWIRDEMVYPNLGEHHGRRLLPLFLSIFFFIVFMNAFGLVPFGVAATGSVFVTAAMATLTLLCMIGGGMMVQGPLKFWKNLIPHGLPAWVLPIMVIVEVIGLLVKPFALTIRLFANMTGGHLVLLSFMGLIFYFGTYMGTAAGFAITPVGVGMGVFMMILEAFVALLQAYIFTLLSIIFVGMCLHPEH